MSATRRHPNVIHLDEADATERRHGQRFALSARRLGAATGARGIGATCFEVPPGRAAFPCHYHLANEESLFVLAGKGQLRIGKDTVELHTGDYVTFPTGPDHAHQLINDGDQTLRYLCFSTMLTTEVVGYPDSNKLLAAAMGPDGLPLERGIFLRDSQVDYYHGEGDEPFD